MDKRKRLNTIKAILFSFGLGALSINATGCGSNQNNVEENLTEDMLKEIDSKLDDSAVLGFIKVGDKHFPVCIKDLHSSTYFNSSNLSIYYYYTGNCYNLETNEYIGKINTHNYGDVDFYSIDKDDEIKYVMLQCFYFNKCNSNVPVTTDMAKKFDDKIYNNLEVLYFDNVKYPGKYVKKYVAEQYVIDSLEPINKKEIVGFQISENEIFNFENFTIENYENWVINEEPLSDEVEKDFCYDEILSQLDLVGKTK